MDQDFTDQIELLRWGHSSSQATGPNGVGGKTVEGTNLGPVWFDKHFDSASIELMKHCWSGRHFEKMTFVENKTSGDKRIGFVKIELQKVVIAQFEVISEPGELPRERFTLSYESIKYDYERTDSLGVSMGGASASFNTSTRVTA